MTVVVVSRWHATTAAALLLLLVVASLLLLVVASLLTPASLAAFTATSANPGNSLATDTLAAPTGFTATCVSSSQVDLNWTVSPTASVTGYRIERRRQGESDFTALATVPDRLTQAYSDTNAPFPSSLLTLLGTITVTYRIRAEIAGTTWRSPHAEASTSGTVTSVLGVTVFNCN